MRFLIIALLLSNALLAQNVTGVVYELTDDGNLPLPGVNVYWEGTQTGTTTDLEGKFSIEKVENVYNLIVSYISYEPDTVYIGEESNFAEIYLSNNRELDEVTIFARVTALTYKDFETQPVQEISRKELQKAACCNLSESFETNASVDVSYSDAVTGAKQIKMLGLAGKYSQIMTENIPNLRGLASAFGIYYIPGSWMQAIQISKGTASVRNGFESITGQINIEYKKPVLSEKFYADVYSNSMLKTDVNTNSYYEVNENLSTLLLVHGEYFDKKLDESFDGFQDHPNVKQFNVINRWRYEDFKNWHVDAGINLLSEERTGGQIGNNTLPASSIYRTGINSSRFQFWSKTGYIFNKSEHDHSEHEGEEHVEEIPSSLGFINMFTLHGQKSNFGLREFDADEFEYYSNLILDYSLFGHKLSSGASLTYNKYDQTFTDTYSEREEVIPGLFSEYTFAPEENFTAILGIRADHHNIEGWFYTPRLHLRYSPFDNTIIRLSAGKGYRTANIISENISLLSSSRNFYVDESLKMEDAVNYGFNVTQYIMPFDRQMSVSLDFYRTEFHNKIIVDIERNARGVHFYNLSGESFANNAQIEIAYELLPRFDVRTAVRYTDAKSTYSGKLVEDPLNKKMKGLLSFSYATVDDSWQFDFTAQFNGKSRIPDLSGNPEANLGEYSPAHTLLLAQISKNFGSYEIYVGGENLTDFKQSNPVIAPDDPYGPNFDASVIWGPVSGRSFYLGARYTLN